MNLTLRATLVAAALVALPACDFLDQTPQANLENDQIFTGPTGAEAAINGAYNRFQIPMDNHVIFSDLAADYAAHTGSFPTWADIDNQNVQTNSVDVSNQYTQWFALINQANILIEGVDATPELTAARKAEIRGEALFFRAFAYHTLVRWFGGVPLITEAQIDLGNVDTPRATVEAIYAQILTDLRAAEPLVGASRSVGFVDRDVVRALTARVLLYNGQYAEAGTIAADVASRFPLVTVLALFEAKNSQESILELQYTTDDPNNMSFFGFVGGGRFEYGPTAQAQASYPAGDRRIPVTFRTNGAPPRTVVGKYFRVTTDDDHHFVLRGAEMLFIQAEVAARAGNTAEAVRLVNLVRTRAGIASIAATTVTTADQGIDLVLAERGRELAYEGHRWHDLVRTGRAVSVLRLTDVNDTLWPIPQRERDINDLLTQNPGY